MSTTWTFRLILEVLLLSSHPTEAPEQRAAKAGRDTTS